MAVIEFYRPDETAPFLSLEDSAVPRPRETVSTYDCHYTVRSVRWALDHLDRKFGQKLRAVVELEETQCQ